MHRDMNVVGNVFSQHLLASQCRHVRGVDQANA